MLDPAKHKLHDHSFESHDWEVHRALGERRIPVVRTLVGNYVTSLDMAGCSLTLCQVDDDLLRLWDAPVRTPALRWGC